MVAFTIIINNTHLNFQTKVDIQITEAVVLFQVAIIIIRQATSQVQIVTVVQVVLIQVQVGLIVRQAVHIVVHQEVIVRHQGLIQVQVEVGNFIGRNRCRRVSVALPITSSTGDGRSVSKSVRPVHC